MVSPGTICLSFTYSFSDCDPVELFTETAFRKTETRVFSHYRNGFSFPSGHAMVTMAFYGYLLYVVVKLVKRKWVRNSLIVLFVSIIFLVGLSRIYLGVHYVTDVLAGYSISLVYLFLVTKIPFFSLEETS